MTREEANKVLEMFLHKQCDLARTEFAYDTNTIWNAVNMAAEVLKQEPILDKLRAEIMTLRNMRAEHFDIESDVFDDRLLLRSDILDIIDKYEPESEV